jgi:hypothetical protein
MVHELMMGSFLSLLRLISGFGIYGHILDQGNRLLNV